MYVLMVFCRMSRYNINIESKYFDFDWRTLMSVEQDKKIQSLYASLKNVMTQNLDKDEQEQLLEWVHKLIIDTAYEKKKVDLLSQMRPLKEKLTLNQKASI